MNVTFVFPAMGRKPGRSYIRSWQMEPMAIAALAGLTPPDLKTTFFDDRLEPIDFDRPTDLVAIPVETYTARRAYQIASDFRRRNVPVVMGGFHASLVPDEVEVHSEAVVIGEAEDVWPQLIEDARAGKLRRRYQSPSQPCLSRVTYDRRIFGDRRYLPVRLVETGRGCRFPCEFCAVQAFFHRKARHRPVDQIVRELSGFGPGATVFFVDDNFAADIAFARELADAIAPLRIRWVTQMSINAAHDEDLLARLAASGCRGVLIGFESLDGAVLRRMRKSFNGMRGGFAPALANLRRHGIRIYGTFLFGYDGQTRDAFDEAVDFAISGGLYLAAFNHLTPFPGTPLFDRLRDEGRLLHERWWVDPGYSYNTVPFRPSDMTAEEVRRGCLEARSRFYAWPSILRRGFDRVNRADPAMLRNFFILNGMHRAEIGERDQYPLGDPQWQGKFLRAA